jgi:Zn-dependent protease with chaperone function
LLLGVLTPKYDEQPDRQSTVHLDEDEYSGIYELVSDVCRRVAAPHPDEIRVAAAAECYVLEQRQFSVSTSRRLILVLGLPEMLLLTTAELRVIVAHEMVHFRSHHTTAVVFLFRFLESLRRAWEPLSQRKLYRLDPIYWFFRLFHALVASLCQPIQRHQELHADAVSGSAYGGDIAVRTLLKDWLLANEFDSAVEEYQTAVAEKRLSPHGSLYTYFVDRSHEFSPQSQEYLERRLLEEQEDSTDDRPTMRRRLTLLRSLPPGEPVKSIPVTELLSGLDSLCGELQTLLVTVGSGTASQAEA